MKPVELVEKAIENSSRKNNVILDLFAGAGSTLIACENLARQARMVEIDPLYVDVIIRRWQIYTGRMAERRSQMAAHSSRLPLSGPEIQH